MWRIVYRPTVQAEVQFEDELTKEEAIERFLDGDFYDIIDSEELEVGTVDRTETYAI